MSVTFISGTNDNWLSLGVTVPIGSGLYASCVGAVTWEPGQNNGGGIVPPPGTANLANAPASTAEVNMYGDALLFLPSGQTVGLIPAKGGSQYSSGGDIAVFGFPYTPSGITVTRTIQYEDIVAKAGGYPGPWDVYSIVNDDVLSNNFLGFTLTAFAFIRPPKPIIIATPSLPGNVPTIHLDVS